MLKKLLGIKLQAIRDSVDWIRKEFRKISLTKAISGNVLKKFFFRKRNLELSIVSFYLPEKQGSAIPESYSKS